MMLQGCASKKPVMPPLASVEGVKRHFAEGRIIDLDKGTTVSFVRLMEELKDVDVVFVGEVHNNPEHHLIQLQILQGLLARYGTPLSVAMEFFDKTRQPQLDQYMRGETEETAFLDAVSWKNNWRFPYHFYRPLIVLVRDQGTRLLGINVPHTIVKKVARGGLKSLTPEERALVAEEMDFENKAHRQYLERIFEQHTFASPHKGDNKGNFEYFYQAQCVWDETMAENIAAYMKKNTGRMVVFTGNGHIIQKFGIPDRLSRRMDISTATIILYPLTERTTINKRMADYVWLTSGCAAGQMMSFKFKHKKPKTSGEKKSEPKAALKD